MTTTTHEKLLTIPLKNGELGLIVQYVQFNGVLKPFIIRKLELGNLKERTVTEQHTLIQSTNDLEHWIAQDEFSSSHPESYDELRVICGAILE